jgi:hypothetical protein
MGRTRTLDSHASMAYGRGQNTARTPMAAPAASATGASAVQKASPATAALASATTVSRVHISCPKNTPHAEARPLLPVGDG